MENRRVTCLPRLLLVFGLLAALVFGAIWFAGRQAAGVFNGPTPETVVASSLQGLREQSRLSTFAARYVAVVTSTQTRFGLSARKTLIMPGLVRYEVDLARLNDRDVKWDAGTKKLIVTLPPLEVIGPQVDLNAIREYGDNGLLTALTDTENQLDTANRKVGQEDLVKQAREPLPMRLARDATRRAVERSFSMPLRAVGMPADVEVRFADEGARSVEQMDRSTSLDRIFANGTQR